MAGKVKKHVKEKVENYHTQLSTPIWRIESINPDWVCCNVHRTDFYHVAKNPNSDVGLPEGLAEKIVRHTFYKWDPNSGMQKNGEEIPVSSEEVVVAETSKSAEKTIEATISGGKEKSSEEKSMTNINLQENFRSKANKDSKFTASESYNGAVVQNYCWSQSISEVDILIILPEKSFVRDVKITTLPRHISVKIKDSVILEGELCKDCKSKEVIWSLENNKLQINIEKVRECWWDCLITTEDKIDLSKIDSSRPFEDLSQEAQAKIEELGWNQHRKQLGLPTSDVKAKEELLRKAWNVEGSPFSGPFDPSSVNFS